MRTAQVIVYGAYGYTGKLIVRECKRRNVSVILSGRDGQKLKDQSSETGFPFESVDVNDKQALLSLLKKGSLVIHCGGPFQYTAKQMAEACLESRTHYTDITGEYTVFELLATYNAKAKDLGVLIMPGVGFDVVPSDCLAVHLKNQLPSATHLQLAFTMSKGGLSRGTSKTMVEGMGDGGMIRKDGKLLAIGLGDKVLDVNFGPFKSKALCIPWGDISTAYRSTQIPNIEVYSGVPANTIRLAKLSRYINFLLRKRWIKDYLLKKIDARASGPNEDKIKNGRSYLWGKVWDEKGNTAEAKLQTVSGYLLTARTAVYIAEKLLTETVQPGYFTPALYFGEDLISAIEGTTFTKSV